MHYYVDILDAHESTYEASERNVRIDPEFEAHLQEEHEGDIATFLALPEIIPAKKRQRQQPLLDFTRSKILTSATYSAGCERLLAQREAHATQGKWKKAEREATKEIMRKQKEEHAEKVRQRKAERDLKRPERERAEAKKRRSGPPRQRRAPTDSQAPQTSAPMQASAIRPATLQHVAGQVHSQATQNLASTSADPRFNPTFTPTHYNIPPGTLNSQFLYNPMPWTFPPPSPTFTLHEASNGQGTSWIPTGPAIHMRGTRDRGERGSTH